MTAPATFYETIILNPKNLRLSAAKNGISYTIELYFKTGSMICLTHGINYAPWFFSITNKINII
jgi:hypothetical protein